MPADYRIQGGFVDAHGVRIYYVAMGHGAPLLIVHGGPGVAIAGDARKDRRLNDLDFAEKRP
jgi:hypothetical protein